MSESPKSTKIETSETSDRPLSEELHASLTSSLPDGTFEVDSAEGRFDPSCDAMDSALFASIEKTAKRLYGLGWFPACSGDISVRSAEDQLWMTRAGCDKSELRTQDLMPMDSVGLSKQRGIEPSTESLLHVQLYNWDEAIGAVIHTRSVNVTALSRQLRGTSFRLYNYEMLKAFTPIENHKMEVFIPVFENTQDIPKLSTEINTYLKQHPHTMAYIIRGHGMYSWGQTLSDAVRHVEALEFLLECEQRSYILASTRKSQ